MKNALTLKPGAMTLTELRAVWSAAGPLSLDNPVGLDNIVVEK